MGLNFTIDMSWGAWSCLVLVRNDQKINLQTQGVPANDDWASSSRILKMRFLGHPVEHNIRSNTSIGLLQRESETHWKDYLQSYDDDLVLLILDQWKGYTCCRIPSTNADIASFSTISTFPSLWKSSSPRKNIAWCSYSSSGSAVGWMLSHSIVSSPRWHNLAAFYCQNFGELEVSSSTLMLYTRLQSTALGVQYSNLHTAR